ncbi:MAG: type II toxin-antitoxin system VapC family toxin [Deltaproteobacteria bacterium]|jgi:PIN domain nuclease of toxin-antitoxin system|nr:type II toxin-antitoxin system VapC family toxin [Deltaproteobacteria bacterium]MBT4266464.1 type II toxin-antitoxin system VapC family toxin [Deltaproteobacteria bacterium]MBT4644142.1 type II toxin-antitoxin system VapC family toxin [Deltaproteobacteria bacterium]MBT7155353.1 type II toxin-antitoxin system VapC family toxin [Deltaproteobacteria bacterium]MBT7715821.1 type II toxin-antitoxin system VapC family toxin [Deltaproteobacteria bacterium]
MSRYLLDTHTFLYCLFGVDKLSPGCKDIITDPENDIFVSSVNLWEISIKKSIGKLQAPEDMVSIVEEKGFLGLPISLEDGQSILDLPLLHKDPFDRMLIVQAKNNKLTIITNDKVIPTYDVKTMSAS